MKTVGETNVPSPHFAKGLRASAAVICALACSAFFVGVAPVIQRHVFRLSSSIAPGTHIMFLRAVVAFVPFCLLWSCCLCGLHRVADRIHKYRFVLGALVILCVVVLNISGSSLGMWNFWLGHDMSADVVWGTPRPIRTDEYIVGTPLAFSQSYTGYGYFNDLFGNKPADMFIIKDAPVWTFAEIFRPFHWGYLLLGSERGLAFYWSARLVVLFLAAYEFFLTVANDNGRQEHKGIACVGASLITFAPIVQWWFAVNSLPELLIAVFVSIVCFDQYLSNSDSRMRAIYAGVILLCAGMFILSLYPAWQISLAYLLVVLIIYTVVRHWRNIRLSGRDILILLAEIAVFGAILASVFVMSWNTIQTTLHTAYPGARQSTGGGLNPLAFVSSVSTLFLPFKEWVSVPGVDFSNSTEVSAFVDLFPAGVVLAAINMYKNKKIDMLNSCLIGIVVFFMLFASVGFPLWLSKLLFLTPVTSSRIIAVVGVANIILLVRSAAQKKWKCDIRVVTVAVLAYAAVIALVNHYTYPLYIGRLLTVGCFVIGAVLLSAFVVVKQQIIRSAVTVLAIIGLAASGMSVNPIQYGAAPLTRQPLTQQVQALQQDNDGMWATDGDDSARLANLLVANGVKTLNALEVTPDLETWKTLDPDGKWEETYNRYAFISVKIQETESDEPFKLDYGDAFTLQVTPEQLRKLGVSNVLSTQKLDQMVFDGYSFKSIGKTIDGRTPYRLVQQ